VQEVVGQDSHEQPGLIGREPAATGLVPAKRILPLFDLVANSAASPLRLGHLPGRAPGIGRSESNTPDDLHKSCDDRDDHPVSSNGRWTKPLRGGATHASVFDSPPWMGAYSLVCLDSWVRIPPSCLVLKRRSISDCGKTKTNGGHGWKSYAMKCYQIWP